MNYEFTHASLFSGIGGFDLAAETAGFKNIFQVEIDKYCNKVLTNNFPDVQRYADIKQFDGSQYDGAIDVISGGFPCQTFSLAGKGAADLSLWKEMYRICSEVKPSYILAENVYGLITQKNGVPFDIVLSDMESLGYEVQPIIIPASGVGACHQRKRVWIVAYSASIRRGRSRNTNEKKRECIKPIRCNPITPDTDTTGQFKQRGSSTIREELITAECNCETITNNDSTSANDKIQTRGRMPASENWQEWATEPPICGVDDGLSNRVDRLKGLGNAIVPQIAKLIFDVIHEQLLNSTI